MIQAIFIINSQGEVVIEKHYRGLVSRTVCDTFWSHVLKATASASQITSQYSVLPIIETSRYFLIHVQQDGMYFLSIVSQETPPLLVIDILFRVVEIFTSYFGSVSEDVLRENFTSVYRLLDEMIDNGMPFNTEPSILRDMIPPPSIYNTLASTVGVGQGGDDPELPGGSLSSIPWRKVGIRYTKDDITFQIIEEIDAIIDRNGQVVNCEVSGIVECHCYLSGMPDLTLIFSNPRLLSDVSFHPCVRFSRWENERVVSFVPPDGVFQLMSYRVTQGIQIPIYVKPQITFNNSGGSVNIMVGPKYTVGVEKGVEDIVISIPFPKTVSTASLNPTHGTCQFDQLQKKSVWTIGSLPKEKSPLLSGSLSLVNSGEVPDSHPPLLVNFLIQNYAASGLKVDNVVMHREAYKNFYKGTTTKTKAGSFQVRC